MEDNESVEIAQEIVDSIIKDVNDKKEEEYLELETINFAVEALYKSILKVMDLHYMYKDDPGDLTKAEETVNGIWKHDVKAELSERDSV